MEVKTYCILYNPHAGNGNAQACADKVKQDLGVDSTVVDITKITNYRAFLSDKENCDIVLCGGDGTLNHFINDTAELDLCNEIWLCPVGTGNDFLRDIGQEKTDKPVNITEYVKSLPVCEVNGKRHRFINGIGFGIDGYCCEVGDKLKAEGKKDINYTGIAIKGLLIDYKPTGANVTVDGKTYRYEKVWIAPTMKGRYYGGGMMPTPAQDRKDPASVTAMLFAGTGKLRTLMIFPKIFTGDHVKFEKAIKIHKGSDITVEFDEPRPLQVDGETVLDVKKYHVYTA